MTPAFTLYGQLGRRYYFRTVQISTPSFCVLVTGLPKASDTFLAASSAAASSANSAKKTVGFFLRIFDAPDIRSFIFERRRMMAACTLMEPDGTFIVESSGNMSGRKDRD
jgi:hypothetical protein